MVDDWFQCHDTMIEARAGLSQLCGILEACGFSMTKEKFQYGQQIVFIGVLLDTVTMSMRFDATQARGMRLQLQSYLDKIRSGGHLDHTTVRHVCGKLNWYAEVVQSGRLHIKSWWDYERNGSRAYPATIMRLVQDTQWWMDLLRTWENSQTGQVEYRILSASELRADPKAMLVLQSDASGTDGFGYYWGYLTSEHMQYTACRWGPEHDLNTSSHAFELIALEHFLSRECTATDAVLVWITDNEGASWSVNKGRCREPYGMELLSSILHQCDAKRLQLLALWVPREHNELADYLSHLAVYLDRDEVRGSLEDLRNRTGSSGEQSVGVATH